MLALFAVASGEQSTPYIEQVFSTYLYEGNGATQTITNGIDLSTKGGLVWLKSRGIVQDHGLTDTVRGADKFLRSNTTAAQQTIATGITSFNANGFSIGSTFNSNTPPATYVSWTFREQAKFFDVVTYTGTGSNTTIAHNLDSVPGCIIVKRTDTTADWAVYHRSLANTEYLVLNTTAAKATGATWWNSTTPTSTEFSVGTDASVNASGGTYVAYLFAHDAGGFGLTGTDNVISCGSATPNPATFEATINLGWEPQWVLTKSTAAVGSWLLTDNMRGMTVLGSEDSILRPNLSDAENTSNVIGITSTGFITQSYGTDFIYIAIRRGPMEIPTVGTTVFNTIARTGTGATATVTAGFPVDMYLMQRRPTVSFPNIVDRLRGNTKNIQTYQTDAETTTTNTVTGFDNMTGAVVGADTSGYVNESGITYANQMFRRAPGFFDEVCYTGTGADQTLAHNLGVIPELIIVKSRSNIANWLVKPEVNTAKFLYLDLTNAIAGPGTSLWSSSNQTASNFYVGTATATNASAGTFVAYLFASCLGVSKVGSYTGTATTQQINCNFTTGARFVLIKRTDSTGDWYVWDTARGIIAGNDPYLLLNSTAAEVTSTDYVDTYAAGFELTSTAPAAINANGGTYIFLAIA
jgi:hypothetical protein